MNRGGALFVDHMQFESFPQLAEARAHPRAQAARAGLRRTVRATSSSATTASTTSAAPTGRRKSPLGSVFDKSFLEVTHEKLEYVARRASRSASTCNLDPLNQLTEELRAIDDGRGRRRRGSTSSSTPEVRQRRHLRRARDAAARRRRRGLAGRLEAAPDHSRPRRLRAEPPRGPTHVPRRPPPLPNFLIIGAQRCAARWLRYNLDQHPDSTSPPSFDAPDGPGFFHDPDCLDRFGVKQYRTRFGAWDGEPVVGECCPLHGVARLGQRPPFGAAQPHRHGDARRAPHRRGARSHRAHVVRRPAPHPSGTAAGRRRPVHRLVEVGPDVKELDLLNGSIYCAIPQGVRAAPARPVLVLFYDDVRDRPQVAYEAALRHIGASTDFVPDDLDRSLFANGPMPEGRPGARSHPRATPDDLLLVPPGRPRPRRDDRS